MQWMDRVIEWSVVDGRQRRIAEQQVEVQVPPRTGQGFQFVIVSIKDTDEQVRVKREEKAEKCTAADVAK